MPRSKQPQNWYERLDEDAQAIVLAIGFIIFVLVLAFVLSNPVLAGALFVTLGLVIFTVYAKYKTGRWWWKSYPSNAQPPAVITASRGQTESVPVERKTVIREIFVRYCSHCGAKVSTTQMKCPNCGAVL